MKFAFGKFIILMRTVTSIFLLLLLVSVQTPIAEFLKFPVLVAHFSKHQQQEGVSLFGFLQEHYVGDHDDDDRKDDEQLPFKNLYCYAIGQAIVPGVITTGMVISFDCDDKTAFSHTFALQKHLASIFHPPKGALEL